MKGRAGMKLTGSMREKMLNNTSTLASYEQGDYKTIEAQCGALT
jgi:hypothetical protein